MRQDDKFHPTDSGFFNFSESKTIITSNTHASSGDFKHSRLCTAENPLVLARWISGFSTARRCSREAEMEIDASAEMYRKISPSGWAGGGNNSCSTAARYESAAGLYRCTRLDSICTRYTKAPKTAADASLEIAAVVAPRLAFAFLPSWLQ